MQGEDDVVYGLRTLIGVRLWATIESELTSAAQSLTPISVRKPIDHVILPLHSDLHSSDIPPPGLAAPYEDRAAKTPAEPAKLQTFRASPRLLLLRERALLVAADISGKLPAARNPQLEEDVGQMPFDSPQRNEQALSDLRVCQPLRHAYCSSARERSWWPRTYRASSLRPVTPSLKKM